MVVVRTLLVGSNGGETPFDGSSSYGASKPRYTIICSSALPWTQGPSTMRDVHCLQVFAVTLLPPQEIKSWPPSAKLPGAVLWDTSFSIPPWPCHVTVTTDKQESFACMI